MRKSACFPINNDKINHRIQYGCSLRGRPTHGVTRDNPNKACPIEKVIQKRGVGYVNLKYVLPRSAIQSCVPRIDHGIEETYVFISGVR